MSGNGKVFVFDADGVMLMPCSPARARILLQKEKATVASMEPFAIKLFAKKDVTNPDPALSQHQEEYESLREAAREARRAENAKWKAIRLARKLNRKKNASRKPA